MTLYRQLLLFTLALCFVLFVGVWIDKLQSTRSFLVNQMESNAQDTATSLGLSLSPFVAAGDLATVETMMNAIFDRGYYRRITLSDVEDKVISERTMAVTIKAVPSWFIDMIPLATPGARAFIMKGWKKAGSVYVESHPGYAYLTLWETAVRITIYFLLTGLVVFILGGVGLQFLLRPLRRVEHQAEAICRREYELQESIPRTRELRQVVLSMNRMTDKVREMFEEQAAIAEKLREIAFGDALTGLGNRRFLSAQITAAMQDSHQGTRGLFLLIQIHDLQKINTGKGYETGDELLRKASNVIADAAAALAGTITARLSGGDFVLFQPHIHREDSERLAATIATGIARLAADQLALSDHICSLGGTCYQSPTTFDLLLAESDMALGSARRTGPNMWLLTDLPSSTSPVQSRGKQWWRNNLEKALASRSIQLYGQKVVDVTSPDSLIHLELFSKIIPDHGEEIPAGVFVPVAERLSQVTELDRLVVELVLKNREVWSYPSLAINMSASSLQDKLYVDWLLFSLSRLPARETQIFFEFPEFSAVHHLDSIREFTKAVQALGHGVGLDHFGRSFSNFGYLKSLKPNYVKIDAGFTQELETENSDSYFFVSALRSVARSLDIKVIAEGVEREAQLDMLAGLNIDGVRGFLVDQPKRLQLSRP